MKNNKTLILVGLLLFFVQLVFSEEIDSIEYIIKELNLIKKEKIQSDGGSFYIYNHIVYKVEHLGNDKVEMKQVQPSISSPIEKTVQLLESPENFSGASESPDGSYFIGYEYTEVGVKNLYFYNKDGSLINTYSLPNPILLSFNFSSKGNYLCINNHFGREFYIFNNTGNLVYSGDFVALSGKGKQYIVRVIPSDDGKYFLLNLSKETMLYDFSGNLIWSIILRNNTILFAHFVERDYIILGIIKNEKNEKHPSSNILVISSTDGSLMREIEGVTECKITNNKLLIKRGEEYYEYNEN